MKNSDWMRKLTPFDTELAIMVESLTERPCQIKNGGNHYFFECDYEKHASDPEYLSAIYDAIAGRAGKRLITITDNPDRHAFIVRVKFSDVQYPGLIHVDRDADARPAAGDLYSRQLSMVRALQVTRENAGRLLAFVGNGEMEIPEIGPAVFHFRNAAGSVWAHAPESSYIVYSKAGLFSIVSKEEFEREFEPK